MDEFAAIDLALRKKKASFAPAAARSAPSSSVAGVTVFSDPFQSSRTKRKISEKSKSDPEEEEQSAESVKEMQRKIARQIAQIGALSAESFTKGQEDYNIKYLRELGAYDSARTKPKPVGMKQKIAERDAEKKKRAEEAELDPSERILTGDEEFRKKKNQSKTKQEFDQMLKARKNQNKKGFGVEYRGAIHLRQSDIDSMMKKKGKERKQLKF